MANSFSNDEIAHQRKSVFSDNPSMELVAPCRIGEGILRLNAEDEHKYRAIFNKNNSRLHFFVPASGSGSRMFQFLYEFIENSNSDHRSQVELFLNAVNELAFFRLISSEMQQSVVNQTIDLEYFINYLLNAEGLGFGHLPKGLIPFHCMNPFILNPFQEQILQGLRLGKRDTSFHFTIQSKYETEVTKGIKHIEGLTGMDVDVSFSEQDNQTDSYAFYENGELALSNSKDIIRRPAGHGALLSNLNKEAHELVFIKNIDNVQHFNKADQSIKTWQQLGGLLIEFRNEALKLYQNPSHDGLKRLNERYQLYSESELNLCQTSNEIKELLNRPTRICGMVKNEGQPGGGPFWVKENGKITKQIVEKAQVSNATDQLKIIVQSTHFNPVMIAASTISLNGEPFDLSRFSDDSKYFIVHKTQHGQRIRYRELPGLWNGSMANWNTIFVEVPLNTFSPVKTILDLLGDVHKE